MWPISIRTGFAPWLGWTIVRLGTTLSWSGQRSLKLAVEQHSTRLWPNEFIVLSIHASGNHLNRFMNPSVNNFFCTFELHWTGPAIFVWFGVGFEQSLNRFNKFCHLLTGKGQAKCWNLFKHAKTYFRFCKHSLIKCCTPSIPFFLESLNPYICLHNYYNGYFLPVKVFISKHDLFQLKTSVCLVILDILLLTTVYVAIKTVS